MLGLGVPSGVARRSALTRAARPPRAIRLCACVLAALGAAVGRSLAGDEVVPEEAAQALAEMRFGLAKLAMEKAGVSRDRLEACDAMRAAFDAACANLKAGKWKPSARDLAGTSGKVLGASLAGLEFRSGGMSMVMPWKSLKPLARQRFLEGASSRPDARVWLARVAYAAWSGLGPRAKEELDAAAKAGAKLPEWLAADVKGLAEREHAREAAKEKPDGKQKPNGRRDRRAAGGGKGLLGSSDFEPTPERPLGWRGDGTGRFPGATPPTEWSRAPRGILMTLRCQSAKPKDAKEGGTPLNMGSVREWLILGPLDAPSAAEGLEKAFVDEARVRPDAGETAAGGQWRPWTVSVSNQSQSWSRLVLDAAFAYEKTEKQEWQNHPGTLEPLVAYAHTYLWSRAAGKVRLRIDGSGSLKAWLNGSPVTVIKGQWDATPEVELAAGWNSLLVKAVSSSKAWHFSAYVAPAKPVEYETKNIVWMTRMPGTSWSSPIVVGDRVFVNADESTLVCVEKRSGRVLWARNTTFYHAVAPEERAKFTDLAPSVQKLDALTDELARDLSAAVGPAGLTPDREAALGRKIGEKTKLERDIREAMGKADKAYRIWQNDRGWSTPTPTSDGEYVYSAFFGGAKGMGSNVVSCFDVNGRRIWGFYTGISGVPEHGSHVSPAISGDRLVYLSGRQLYGFDRRTGKVVWQKEIRGCNATGASILATRVGNLDVAFVPQSGIYRSADGELLWKTDFEVEIPTPFIIGNVICGISSKDFFELQLPAAPAAQLSPKCLVKTPWKGLGMHLPGTFTDSIIGSPLFEKGLVYVASEGGGLTVVDASTGRAVYTHALDDLNPRLTWVFVVGICTGPALAGEYVHIRDDQAQTVVIEPGPAYKLVAKNVLVEIDDRGFPVESQSNPFFEGDRMYYRSSNYLYCIGER